MTNPYNCSQNEKELEYKVAQCLTKDDKAEIISWTVPDFDREISIENINNGFVYTPNTNGYIKINRINKDGMAFIDIYKGVDATCPVLFHCSNAHQFNTGSGSYLLAVEKGQSYFVNTTVIARLWISFIPCKGA